MFLRTMLGLYSLRLPNRLVSALRAYDYSIPKYLHWFHSKKSLKLPEGSVDQSRSQLVRSLQLLVLVWLILLVILVAGWLKDHKAGFWAFSLSLLLAYPLIIAYGLAIFVGLYQILVNIFRPKKMARAVVCTLLEWQVRKLRKKHKFTVVAVAGAVGKTSTKLAIAQLLSGTKRVRFQQGNYNDRVTIPLVFFGHEAPSLYNPFAWARIVGANESTIAAPYPYDVVVVELGTDAPGQIKKFSYIKPDVTVVTSVTPEHMENFGTIEAVAKEELTVAKFSKRLLINTDDTPESFLTKLNALSYGFLGKTDYKISRKPKGLEGQSLSVKTGRKIIKGNVKLLGDQGAKIASAAVAVADMLEVPEKDITASLAKISSMSGRMQVMSGIKSSTLIDDTYNATPTAVKAALDVLYSVKSPQKIAVLGSMNELGGYAKEAHQIVGNYCDPKQLDMVVTVGGDAMRWIAPKARANGCVVHTFKSPFVAGEYVLEHLKKNAVVLAKGSQNGVFTEEVLKKLLLHPKDAKKLVRQSKPWLKAKRRQFKD